MANGIPSSQDPLISFDLAGPANGKPGYYHWDYRNFAPRLGLAYSPHPGSDFLKRLFGDGDKTAIRAGFGMAYDHIGSGLLQTFDQWGSFGLATSLLNSPTETLACAPRVTSVNVIPTTDCKGNRIFLPAPPGGFPQTPSSTLDTGGFAIDWGLDNSIRTPYSYMLDFSISRELPGGFLFEASCVGHLSHRLLVQEDMAMPLNLVDPKSGVDYFSAARRLAQLGVAGTDFSAITPALVGPTAAYWTNMLAPLQAGGAYDVTPWGCRGGPTTSALTAAYELFNCFLHNESTGLGFLDVYGGIPDANDPNMAHSPVGGANSYFNRQFASLYAWRSIGTASYHGLQLALRKRMDSGLQFDFNYTFAKSIDLASDAERIPPFGGLRGGIINSWDYKAQRAVSDFDATHQINANWIWQQPLGKGRPLGRNARGAVNALVGGWQLTGIYRWTRGFPIGVSNGLTWPTNWQKFGWGVLDGPKPATATTKNGDGSVNIFPHPATAFQAFRHAYPGESGSRNILRGDGFFSLDMGLSKRWKMPYSDQHSLQFRWEVFNVPNATRFNTASLSLALDQGTSFGHYTQLLTNPRVMQFALRYEF